jgi:hypothetical protein
VSRGAPDDLADLVQLVLQPLAREGARLCRNAGGGATSGLDSKNETTDRRFPPVNPAGPRHPDVWRRNVAALRRSDPALADRVEAEGRRLGCDAGAGSSCPAPDPGEAATAVPDARNFMHRTVCVLFGVGSGAFVRTLPARLRPDAWILVIERSLESFCRTLAGGDFSPLFARPRARFFVGGDLASFRPWIGAFSGEIVMGDFAVVDSAPAGGGAAGFYEPARQALLDALRQRRIEVTTITCHGERLERNSFANVPEVLASGDVGSLAGAFPGVPAIVVGAGPSLDEALPLLRAVRDRVLLLAVGKAARPMAAAGCPPHVVVAMDPLPVTAEYFRNLGGLEEILLFFDPDSEPSVVRDYPGPRCSYLAGPFYEWAEPHVEGRTRFPRGMTVAHQAFFLARHLGSDPIALVGIDLAFPGRRTHAAGTDHTWGGQADPDAPNMAEVPAVRGGRVLSQAAFAAFRSLFEAEIGATRAKVVNCSPAGARIEGAQEEPLEAFLARHAVRPVDAARLGAMPRRGAAAWTTSPALRRAVESALAGIRRVRDDAEAGLAAVRRAEPLNPEDPAQAGAVAEATESINAPRRRILDARDFHALNGRLVGAAAIRGERLQRLCAREQVGTRARLQADLVRMANYFEGFRDAAAFLEGALGGLLSTFDVRQQQT